MFQFDYIIWIILLINIYQLIYIISLYISHIKMLPRDILKQIVTPIRERQLSLEYYEASKLAYININF